jgi:hypothetical protein
MNRGLLIGSGVVAAAGLAAWLLMDSTPDDRLADDWAMLGDYCVECHNDSDFTGELSLQGRSPDDVHADPGVWEEVARKLRIGLMPPREQAQPDPELRSAFLNSLIDSLDAAAAAEPYAASTTVHRLNRVEYANSIRDLLGVEADIADLLPSDGGDFGFDNIAEVLTTSPLLLERYLTVAIRVADFAVGNAEAAVSATTYKIPVEVTQDYHLEGLPLGTRGGVRVQHNFPADGEYVFAGRLIRGVEEGYFGIEGHDVPHEFLVFVDGEVVYTNFVGGEEDHQRSVSEGINVAQFAVDEKLTSPRVAVSAGPHDVVFTWKERPAASQDVWEPGLRASLEAHNPSGMPRLETGIVEGPYNVTGISDTPSRDILFSCRPESEAHAPACAEEILTNIARGAFRRPVGSEDIVDAMAFYEDERRAGGDFEAGIRVALSRILVSPQFLFRVEVESPDVPAGSTHPVSDYELASRLSFFLWSSIPDEELLALAEAGTLRDPENLEAQVRRMIADDRSAALVENFTGQWLQLRNLDNRVRPDILLFPDFDANLRQAFRRETEMLFAHVLRENRPVHEIVEADYTFVNERLARHYGIDGVYGARFRQVELDDPNRFGIFGHGSLLSLTASGTAPILRGKFITTEFWNNPPPAPPEDVPQLEESAPEGRPSTVREQLEVHRANPTCAACHNNIDPIGFALENFDEVGQWRETTRDGLEIDSAGVLGDGRAIDGPVELRQALLSDPEVFAGTVTEKLMIYALGRGLTPGDKPVVRSILRNAAETDYALSSIVLGIVDSFPFQMRRNLPPADQARAAF